MQRAMGPHACPFLFFYFLLCEAGNEPQGGGKPHPYYIRAWQAGPLSLRLWGRDPAPQGDPRVPTPLPAAPAPTRYPQRAPKELVGEQAEEDFVAEQPSSFAES